MKTHIPEREVDEAGEDPEGDEDEERVVVVRARAQVHEHLGDLEQNVVQVVRDEHQRADPPVAVHPRDREQRARDHVVHEQLFEVLTHSTVQ